MPHDDKPPGAPPVLTEPMVLVPGLRRIWRDRHRLQLGLDPGPAVVLEFPDRSAAAVLDLFDGARDDHQVIGTAVTLGLPRHQVEALLRLLRAHRLVLPARVVGTDWLPEPLRRQLRPEIHALALRYAADPAGQPPDQALRRRHAARVLLTGPGPVALPLARALAAAGVGHLHLSVPGATTAADRATAGLHGTDVGRPLAQAGHDAIIAASPLTEVRPLRPEQASLVIASGETTPPALQALRLRRAGPPVLNLAVRAGTVTVGPLDEASASPCPYCRELHRRDRDPHWPALAASLAVDGPVAEPCAVATLLSAVGYAAAEALAVVEKLPVRTRGAALVIVAPGEVRRHSWPVHPDCDCSRRSR